MKRSLIITIGIVLILLVLGVWAYLLFFGTPKDGSDVFTNLGIEAVPRPTSTMPVATTTETLPAEDQAALLSSDKPLRQLTLRSIAGFGFVEGTPLLRYIERGTGYIYEVDLEKGTEARVSGTTIPRVVDGYFSPNGESVVLVAETDGVETLYAGYLDDVEENVKYLELPEGATQPGFVDHDTLRYLSVTDIGSEGYELDLESGTSIRIFSVPLRDITMIWGDELYFYNKPTRYYEGALYKIESNLLPILPARLGFVGGVAGDNYISSHNEEGRLISEVHLAGEKELVKLAISYIPDKCAAVRNTQLWCGAPLDLQHDVFLEEWYRGETQSKDSLWKINPVSGQAILVSDLLAESGRVVDVDRMVVNNSEQTPVFRNKIDNTLWIYDAR